MSGSITPAFSFHNESKTVSKDTFPLERFRAIKDHVLGENYRLSVVSTFPQQIRKYNLMYRDINKATDILSFPLSDTEGEIYLCNEEIIHEAKKFDRSYDNFVLFLFIHGCVHLKGYDHGATMEEIEVKVRTKFGV